MSRGVAGLSCVRVVEDGEKENVEESEFGAGWRAEVRVERRWYIFLSLSYDRIGRGREECGRERKWR